MGRLLSAITASRPAKTLSNGIIVVTSIGCFFYTLNVLYRLMCFTSDHNEDQKTMVNSAAEENPYLMTLWMLLIDACLLSCFMLQHSLMATEFIKNIYKKFYLSEIERSIYNASSAAALQLLINNWQAIPSIPLWNVNTSESNKLWLVFVAFHVLGWLIVYSGCFMIDMAELAGIKQVYYKLSSRPCPLSIKSRELQRYYVHMRHPSFTGFLMILWIHPFMTIDRFLFSSLLSLYMIMMWSIDKDDYRYHSSAIKQKRRYIF